MKYAFFFLCFCTGRLQAQTTILEFNKRFVESEDKWVALPMGKDSMYNYGFIYIDAMAGLTLNYEGRFKIGPGIVFMPHKTDSIIKIRLKPNNVLVAFIPESRFDELHIKAVPDWLAIYKTGSDSVGHMVRWGFLYNSWDEPVKALTYLEKAYTLDPDYKGLRFELAFAYNALRRYAKAVPILEKAMSGNAGDCQTWKELVFAEVNLSEMDKAIGSYKKAALTCTDKSLTAEMAFNIAYHFYLQKDKASFSTWATETKNLAPKGSQIANAIAQMEQKEKE